MLSFLKRKTTKDPETETPASTTETAEIASSTGFLHKLKQNLSKTRSAFTDGLVALFKGKKVIDQALFSALEMHLLSADVGMPVTTQLMEAVAQRLTRHELSEPASVLATLKELLIALLRPCQQPLVIAAQPRPYVILVIGVNGSGKTTTIGKLASYFHQAQHSLVLAAGDTFRAAAIEQLKVWGDRNSIPVIAQEPGADSASVIFDAVQSARARHMDIVLADTAGRLHTQLHLMDELKKIKRVIQKLDSSAPHEVLLVLDASIGQNAIQQTRLFHEALGVTGLVLTKLDGTAKGGVIFAIAEQFKLPIRFIGIGEGLTDLQPFDATAFVDALFEGVA